MTIAVWLKKIGKKYKIIDLSMIFMFSVTILALILLIRSNFSAGNYVLVVFPIALLLFSFVLIYKAVQVMKKPITKVKA